MTVKWLQKGKPKMIWGGAATQPEVQTQPFVGLTSAKAAALAYISNGLAVIPLKPKSKEPNIKGWPQFECAKEEVPKHFSGEPNIAVLLGEASGWVVDVDLDSPEAVALAPSFLPKTACMFGRQSKGASHWVYRVGDTVESLKREVHVGGSKKMLLELRSTGCATMFPPSTHPTGELVKFESGKAGLPTEVDVTTLIRAFNRLAAAAAMAWSWPQGKSVRQDLAMALAGGLLRAGVSADETMTFVTCVVKVAGDDEVAKRKTAVAATIKKHASGKPTTGWPKVAGLLGPDGQYVVDTIREWLGDINNAPPSGKLVSVTADHVVPKMVEWLWQDRIAFGAIAILDGDPSMGKSTICSDLAARVSAGKPMPLGGGQCDAAGVVVLSSEDSLANTVVPRLKAASANPERVELVHGVTGEHGSTLPLSIPEHLPALREAIISIDARLVVIEPLLGFISLKAHAHNDQQVRWALAPLASLADETGAAVLAVRHLTKKAGASAVYRGGGSIALIGAARTGMVVGEHLHDPTCRVLAMTKTNLGPYAPSLRYRIVGKGSPPGETPPWEAGVVEWLGETDIHANDLVGASGGSDTGALKDAMSFLAASLKDGPMKAADVFSLSKHEGHTKTTIRRAAKKLGIVKTQVHDGQKIVGWEWSLPAEPDNGPVL